MSGLAFAPSGLTGGRRAGADARTVLSVAYPFARVDADPVGGAEQVLSILDREMVQAGWRSLVIACAGSAAAGELVAVPAAPAPIDAEATARVHAEVREAIGGVLARERVDLIHLHGIDFAAYLPPPGAPVLVSLHLPIAWYGDALANLPPNTWLLPVSRAQAASAPRGLALLDPIENGVVVDGWPRPRRRCRYALALGRICPEKGFHLALDAAKAAGVPLRLAGEVFPYPSHQVYFAEEIAPRLDAKRRYVGPLQGGPKRRAMAAARCVLIPSTAPETSSLVAREAAAAGTPVIAFANGALSDAVEHGKTGFLVGSVEEMAAAIGRVEEIDPDTCRRVARARFAAERMSREYLELYDRLVCFQRAAPVNPEGAISRG